MKRWTKYIKPYLLYFILGPLCMIIEVVGEVFMPRFLAGIINDSVAKGIGFTIEMTLGMITLALIMMAGGVGGAYFHESPFADRGFDPDDIVFTLHHNGLPYPSHVLTPPAPGR